MVYHHKQSIHHSLGHHPPDLLLTGGKIVDVQSGLVKTGDIIIKGHRIVGLYDDFSNFRPEEIIDIKGKYVLPGFIEPHIHIESSMLTLTNFSRVVLPRGTTTVINDPHEIANVMGVRGVRQMMDEGHYSRLRYYFTVPSCIPTLSPDFETTGASYTLEDVKQLLMEKDSIGLGEMMNFPGVIQGDTNVLVKIYETYRVRGFKKLAPIIDGHCPGLSGPELSAYINAGIMADHECTTGEELEERLRKGMYVMVRNGSSAKNMEALLQYVIRKGLDTRRLMFCSDDRNPFDLLHRGHIDQTLAQAAQLVKKAGHRLRTIDIIRMATLNPAEFFHMPYRGRLGIGTRADLVVVDDLEDFRVHLTIRNGELVARNGELLHEPEEYPYHDTMLNSVHLTRSFTSEDFAVPCNGASAKVRVIGLLPGQLLTKQLIRTLHAKNGRLEADVKNDILKVVVVERHHGNNNFAIGFVRGFGIKSGAVAMTIGHDSHNLGVIGTNDKDIAYAIHEINKMQGGVVVVAGGKTRAKLELRVGGLMSMADPEQVVKDKIAVYDAYQKLGGRLKDPIITMSFIQLPVIPELKISDRSLIEMTHAGPQKVSVFAE